MKTPIRKITKRKSPMRKRSIRKITNRKRSIHRNKKGGNNKQGKININELEESLGWRSGDDIKSKEEIEAQKEAQRIAELEKLIEQEKEKRIKEEKRMRQLSSKPPSKQLPEPPMSRKERLKNLIQEKRLLAKLNAQQWSLND